MKTSRTLFGLAASVPLALSLLSAASAQTMYNFTDFDASGVSSGTTVNGISNTGAVVGSYLNSDGTKTTNFSGTPDALTQLNLSTTGTVSANGINSSGLVVGSDGSNGAFLLDSTNGSGPTTLPLADSTETSQMAFGVNDKGTIVGQYTRADKTMSGFVDTAGSFTALDPAGVVTSTSAQGINNNGLVVGFYAPAGNSLTSQGFSFNPQTGVYTTFADPSVSDLSFTQFLGINDSGEAVGYYQTTTGIQHGFLYNTNAASDPYTFLDDPNVSPDGSSIMQITGITDSGEIAGFYTDGNGTQFGFTANPAVPESSSLVSLGLLLALGVGGVYVMKRRKVVA